LTTHSIFLERDPFFRNNRPLLLSSAMALCVSHTQQACPQDFSTKHFDMLLSPMLRLKLPCILVTVSLIPRSGDVIVFHMYCGTGSSMFVS
jgi:hypothetical protein